LSVVILGIDPGFGITGYGLIEIHDSKAKNPEILEAGILKSKQNKNISERLFEIYKSLNDLLQEFSPSVLAIEEIYSISRFPRSAIFIGNVQGIVLLAAAQRKIPVFSYFPIQIKKILLGYGRGTKLQMQKMVQRTFKLETVPKPDDVADALAVALCHAHRTYRG